MTTLERNELREMSKVYKMHEIRGYVARYEIREIQTNSIAVRFTGYVTFTIGTIIGSTRATYELCTPTVCVARLRTSPNLKDLSFTSFGLQKVGVKVSKLHEIHEQSGACNAPE